MNTPLFEGELVRLGALRSDAEAETIVRWSRDSEFLRLVDEDPARPWSVKSIREEFEEAPRPDRCEFLIRALADDRPIGFVNLARINGAHRDAWVGIGIGDRACWGRGYGTDAMCVILRYAFTELNLHRVTLGVFDYNPRAIRSYEKAGFKLEGRLRGEMSRQGNRHDILIMGILRSEWEMA